MFGPSVRDIRSPRLAARLRSFGDLAVPDFRKLDYPARNYVIGNVATVNKAKRYVYHFEGKTHDTDCLRVRSLAIEVRSDRHVHLS
jgi:hypothetical protein